MNIIHPERIFATVNGASTRLPDGGRQLIGGWCEDSARPRVQEYVRADIVETVLEALIMVRDADNDCRLDGLPTIPSMARNKIDQAIAKAEAKP
ncbi:hypothetical protein [Pelagibacterium lentulum]|uniref:Uncharacterized protein n=1 Tax=Pelagibacterium lentulum TaxID=2029865 RepID=A0A916R9G0_9HYPH|nr:hypothetical protein [Pelagibacterium lentulum]GGA45872.1 hypothetical protein GCM10011499_14520 [Pelagibacterium lentulum]